MENKQALDGARWAAPDWTASDANGPVNYLDHINFLEQQLRMATDKLNDCLASNGYVDPDSLSAPPKPRLKPMPFFGIPIPKNFWNRNHRVLREYAKIVEIDFDEADNKYAAEEFVEKFSPTQIAEVAKFGYTYPSLKQDDLIYKLGKRLTVEKSIMEELFLKGMLDINSLSDTELVALRDVTVCSHEIRRRNDIRLSEESRHEMESMASLKKIYESTIAHCEGMPVKIKTLEASLAAANEAAISALETNKAAKRKSTYLAICLFAAVVAAVYGLLFK